MSIHDGYNLQVAPYDILRIDKSEGSAAVAIEEGIQDLNQEITGDKHSSLKGKVKLTLSQCRCINSIQLL